MGMTNFKIKKGFTLIEMVIVIGVIAVILPTMFGSMYMILRQQLQIYRLNIVKRQGDAALQVMKDAFIFQATSLGTTYNGSGSYDEYCTEANQSFESTGNDDFGFYEVDTLYISQFSLVDGTLVYSRYLSASPSEAFINTQANLTDDSVIVTNLLFSCYKKDDASTPIVLVGFDITFNDPTPTAGEANSVLHYQTRMKLRNTPD